jgi:hypothetical protein
MRGRPSAPMVIGDERVGRWGPLGLRDPPPGWLGRCRRYVRKVSTTAERPHVLVGWWFRLRRAAVQDEVRQIALGHPLGEHRRH